MLDRLIEEELEREEREEMDEWEAEFESLPEGDDFSLSDDEDDDDWDDDDIDDDDWDDEDM